MTLNELYDKVRLLKEAGYGDQDVMDTRGNDVVSIEAPLKDAPVLIYAYIDYGRRMKPNAGKSNV